MSYSYISNQLKRYWMPLLFAAAMPIGAQAQSMQCGDGVKYDIAKTVADAHAAGYDEEKMAAVHANLYEKYKYCIADGNLIAPTDPIHTAARQCGAKITHLGNIFYEEMPCCGYDPQRRAFACPVKIKRQTWYGVNPLPGSREHVFHCVANQFNVFVPVGHDSVHLSNSQFAPTWQFAVVANANNPFNMGVVQPMNGQPRRARSILSWETPPTNCNFLPFYGNVIEYTIRLDQ